MNISFSPPDISDLEIAEVVSTLKSGWITTGPKTKLFEQQIADFCGTKKAVCLNSATACLELTLRLLGIGEGDEVITTAYTYTATASVIHHVGAKIIMIDVKKDTLEMDYDKVSELINEKTKAIIAVDIAGVICDYQKIFKIASDKKSLFNSNNKYANQIGRIAVIADGAHSFGAISKGVKSGAIADFTTFSFHAVKNLTTGEGGAVTFSNTLGLNYDEIYKEYMLLSLHGQSKDALAKSTLGGWEYDVITPAFKCNMTDIMASIGICQLKRYEDLLAHRHQSIDLYNKVFEGTMVKPLAHIGENYLSSGHLYITRLEGKNAQYRNDLIIKLAELGIATNVHYKPLPMLTAYKNLGFDIKHYPNAYEMFENEITFPLHTQLKNENIEYISDNVNSII